MSYEDAWAEVARLEALGFVATAHQVEYRQGYPENWVVVHWK